MYRRQDHQFPADEPDTKRQRPDNYKGGPYNAGRGKDSDHGFNNRRGRTERPTPKIELKYTPADELPKTSHISADFSDDIVEQSPGTIGTVDALITNYAYVSLPTDNVHQYSIVTEKVNETQSELGSAKVFNGMILHKLQREKFPNLRYVFDGGDLIYSIDMFEPIETIIDGIKVTIKWVKDIPLNYLNFEALQVLNVALRHSMRKLGRITIGRNQYNLDARKEVLQQPVFILPGFKSTLTPTSLGLLYTSDVIFKSIRKDTILDNYNKLRNRFSGEQLQNAFKHAVIGKIVFLSYRKQTVTITGVAFDKTPKSTFFMQKQSRDISYKDYYSERYKTEIRDLYQPLLICQRKYKPQEEYFIPELCQMTGLTDDMINDNRVKQDMKKTIDITGAERMQRVQEDIMVCAKNEEFNKELAPLNMSLAQELIAVTARILPTESVEFGNKEMVRPDRENKWTIFRQHPYKTKELKNWLLVTDGQNVQNWLSNLQKCLIQMKVGYTEPKIIVNRSPQAFATDVKKAITEHKYDMVVAIVPSGDERIYHELKRVCLEQVGVPLQCIHPNKIGKSNMSVITKVGVQIICKMGGAPWRVNLSEPDLATTMICGIDLHHSGELKQHKDKKKSVVGFCATLGNTHTTFCSSVSIQDSGTDMIETVTPMFKRALQAYHARNKKYPEHVLLYRNGVSSSEIIKVKENELFPIDTLMTDICENKAPDMPECTQDVIKLNYVAVLKNIQTRFVRAQNGYGNPQAGTVIDTGVTLPGVLDFYLVAHHASPGSSAPTRYQVLYNYSEWTADFYQGVTNKLCGMYYNWFGAIKAPAHCQYAKALAKMVGQSEIKNDHDGLRNKLYFL